MMSIQLGQAQSTEEPGLQMPFTKEGMRNRTGKTTSQQLRKVKGGSLHRGNQGARVEVYADLLSWDY